MARSYARIKAKALAHIRKESTKKSTNNDMYYCKNCGWGWQLLDSLKCPNCHKQKAVQP